MHHQEGEEKMWLEGRTTVHRTLEFFGIILEDIGPANPNNWYPTLKEKLTIPLEKAGNPSFTKILHFLNKTAYHIYPKGSPVCAPNAFFGKCFHGEKCK